jgi:curved DNA-binding protein CbpA
MLKNGAGWGGRTGAGRDAGVPFPELRPRTYYQILGVDPAAEGFLIEAAYRAQMRRRHPDRGGDTARAQLINEAYRVLRDPEMRHAYDDELRGGAGALGPVAHAGAGAGGVDDDDRQAVAAPDRLWTSLAYTALGVLLVASAALSARAPLEAAARSTLASFDPGRPIGREPAHSGLVEQ